MSKQKEPATCLLCNWPLLKSGHCQYCDFGAQTEPVEGSET